MSNVLTSNPWLLDTANTSTVLTTLKIRINRIKWQGATADDVLILKDRNGATKIQWTAVAKDNDVYDAACGPGQDWDGLIAYQIPHGLVEIVYE